MILTSVIAVVSILITVFARNKFDAIVQSRVGAMNPVADSNMLGALESIPPHSKLGAKSVTFAPIPTVGAPTQEVSPQTVQQTVQPSSQQNPDGCGSRWTPL